MQKGEDSELAGIGATTRKTYSKWCWVSLGCGVDCDFSSYGYPVKICTGHG